MPANMLKRVVFTIILAAGTFAVTAAQRADDPYPCPECGPDSGNGPIARLALADDPYPCPECGPDSGNGPIAR